MVSTMDLIASRAISWPLLTIDRNWSCSSCWVLVLVLAIVFCLLLASAANFTKQCLACQAEVLYLVCGGRWRGASAGAGGLRRAPGGGRLGRAGRGGLRRGGLGGRGLSGGRWLRRARRGRGLGRARGGLLGRLGSLGDHGLRSHYR